MKQEIYHVQSEEAVAVQEQLTAVLTELRDGSFTDDEICTITTNAFSDLGDIPAMFITAVLIRVLPSPDYEELSLKEKKFWTAVATFLGPDWIQSMRTAALFMKYIDAFRVNEGR